MPQAQPAHNQTPATMMVIVPCFNSQATIRRCLRALLEQDTTIDYEVIVVDSSTDDTPRIVREEFPDVRLIHLETRTFAGAARNIGVRASAAEFCMMVDSDCIAARDLIAKTLYRHRQGQYAAVGGSIANGTPGSLSGFIGYLAEFKEYMPSTRLRLVDSMPTANITYRREAFERAGGFDDTMWLAEDILLNWKMTESGEQILFDPEIRVTHLNRTGWWRVLPYQVSLGRLSAEARRRGSLPGQILLKFPPLILLMPLSRSLRAARWLADNDGRAFLKFLLIWPLYMLACTFWAFGFLQGAIRRPEDPPPIAPDVAQSS